MPKPLAITRILIAAATFAGCSDDGALTDPADGGPDFTRELQPGEYQVSVTGEVERAFEATGASWAELGDPPFTGWNRVSFFLMGDSDALDGAGFDHQLGPDRGVVQLQQCRRHRVRGPGRGSATRSNRRRKLTLAHHPTVGGTRPRASTPEGKVARPSWAGSDVGWGSDAGAVTSAEATRTAGPEAPTAAITEAMK